MRRFRFRLQTVLRHRTILEELRLQDFAQAHNEMIACDAELGALRQEFERTVAARPGLINPIEIARREQYLDMLTARIVNKARIREGIAARLEEARQALVLARQAREAIERVRAKDKQEHEMLSLRAEQQSIDEMATARFRRDS